MRLLTRLPLTSASIVTRQNCTLPSSRVVGKGSFPLDLPEDFVFTSHSVAFSNGRRTIPHAAGQSLSVHNPANEETIQYIDCAPSETVTSAIEDANRVFTLGQWSRAPITDRFHILTKVANLLRQHAKELAARILP
jgi:hypothetical protein